MLVCNSGRKIRFERDSKESRCRPPGRSGRDSAFLYRQALLTSTLGLFFLLPFACGFFWRQSLLARPSGEIESQSLVPAPAQQQEHLPTPGEEPGPPLTKKQKQELLKSNFEKMKRDADELAELAKSLQEDLDKSNQNVLSLKVVERAEKIEKLARKIKTAAKGQ
jgi:hypothetical protein